MINFPPIIQEPIINIPIPTEKPKGKDPIKRIGGTKRPLTIIKWI